ncbi:MAG: 1,4-alpha-glucan branching protein domain-containing protein [Candidatus Melainabacteria bacterium]|nr:1,4-alpha-glucan branching protein domain-containing protein [Candidatus Melainabacteria bacterium]
MGLGSFVLMLHSHLPFYRKAGMWPFGEENLYECMAETYLPLLNLFYELKESGIQAGVTVGITPILAEQLNDPHLQQGFVDYLLVRLNSVQKDIERFDTETVANANQLGRLARYYRDWFAQLLSDYEHKYHRNLLAAFRQLQDDGCIEITTSAATHGFLPLLGNDASIEAQLKTGVETYKYHFGREPQGVWLPECAYRPAKEMTNPETGETQVRPCIDAFLHKYGLKYFFTEYHAIEGAESASNRRVFGIYDWDVQYLPMLRSQPSTGLSTHEAYWLKEYPVAVMARNNRASFQVWSASYGYPGDGLYREFHRRDDQSGMHYWRLTSKDCDLGQKLLYDPQSAHDKAKEHASHFVSLVNDLAKEQYGKTGEQALIMVSFDTELFGHWWFEGIEWLKAVITGLHSQNDIAVETAGQYVANHSPRTAIQLPESTWGQGGHYWVWNNHNTDWMWPLIHEAETRMKQLANQYAAESDGLKVRVLNQMARELLLLESSDWPFLVTTFQAKDYAVERFQTHVDHFWALARMLEATVDEAQLAQIEEKDNPFQFIDYRWYNAAPIPQPTHVVAPHTLVATPSG